MAVIYNLHYTQHNMVMSITYTQCTYTHTLGIPMNKATLTSEAHHMVYIWLRGIGKRGREREGGRGRKERRKERERD